MGDEDRNRPGSGDDATADPFARLAALREELRETVGPETVDGSMAVQLFEAGGVLERVHAAAVELQRGAEGFDNTGNARRYAEIQDRLAAATREIASAGEVLVREHKTSLYYTHVPKDDVLGRLRDNHACLEAALAALADGEIVEERTVGDRSVRDVIAQVIAREQRALEKLRRASRGKQPAPDDPHAFDRAVEAVRVLPPALLREAMRTSFEQVVAAVEGLADEDFGPTGAVVRALDNSVHMTLAFDTYGFYADRCRDLEAVARARR